MSFTGDYEKAQELAKMSQGFQKQLQQKIKDNIASGNMPMADQGNEQAKPSEEAKQKLQE